MERRNGISRKGNLNRLKGLKREPSHIHTRGWVMGHAMQFANCKLPVIAGKSTVTKPAAT